MADVTNIHLVYSFKIGHVIKAIVLVILLIDNIVIVQKLVKYNNSYL